MFKYNNAMNQTFEVKIDYIKMYLQGTRLIFKNLRSGKFVKLDEHYIIMNTAYLNIAEDARKEGIKKFDHYIITGEIAFSEVDTVMFDVGLAPDIIEMMEYFRLTIEGIKKDLMKHINLN